MNPLIHLKQTIPLLLLPLALACFALLPRAQALTASPDVITDPDETFPSFNTAAGLEALLHLTTGVSNTAYGARALRANTTGGSNLAIGGFALINNIDGNSNTAVGNNAMFGNQHGDNNMALGQGALRHNVSGNGNVAMGAQALAATTASNNTGVGYQALTANIIGVENTAVGLQAMVNNRQGTSNTAVGSQALRSNIGSQGADPRGNNNTALGTSALFRNTSGSANTAVGIGALGSSTTGSENIALGADAGINLRTGNLNIDIGSQGVAAESNTIRIGDAGIQSRAFVAGISGVAVSGPAVVVNGSGQLGVTASSARFKDHIKPMDKASEAIHALKPVTFRYKKEIDAEQTPQFGLIAEEVEKVNPDLVARDAEGKVYSVRYEAVNAMLLNEFLKEHATVQELKKEIAELKVGLQKVSAQIELKSAPQTVLNNH